VRPAAGLRRWVSAARLDSASSHPGRAHFGYQGGPVFAPSRLLLPSAPASGEPALRLPPRGFWWGAVRPLPRGPLLPPPQRLPICIGFAARLPPRSPPSPSWEGGGEPAADKEELGEAIRASVEGSVRLLSSKSRAGTNPGLPKIWRIKGSRLDIENPIMSGR
jgi:hypothetical protein